MDLMKKKWHRYRYKNITYLVVSLIVAGFLLRLESFHAFLTRLGELGYVGAFFAGVLFVSTFTVSVSTVILLVLAETLDPIEIGVIAGIGAVLGDLTIFRFMRSKGFVSEIKHFFQYFGTDKLAHLLHTRYFSWTLPVLGALIIASPLPDELGISMMGISHMKTSRFILVSFMLNSIGIALIVLAAQVVKL